MSSVSQNATVLLIGASRGLGHAIAGEYIDRGSQVVATVRGPGRTALHDLQSAAGDRNVTTEEFVRLMVTNALSPMRVIETLGELGGPDARLTVSESIPSLVTTIDAQRGCVGLQYLDYQGQTVAW